MRSLVLIIALILSLGLIGCSKERQIPTVTKASAPPPGMAIVNIHYTHGNNRLDWSVHNEKGEFLFFLAPESVHQVVVAPGERGFYVFERVFGGAAYFHSGGRLTVAAGKIYDIEALPSWTGGCKLNPISPKDKDYNERIIRGDKLAHVGVADRAIPDNAAREKLAAARIGRIEEELHRALEKNPDVKKEWRWMDESECRP